MKRRTFTEQEFKKAVASSHSIRQALIALGLCPHGGGSYRSFHRAVKDYNVDTSHFKGQGWNKGNPGTKRNLEDYFSNEYPIGSHRLRLRLLAENYFPHRCSLCGLEKWRNSAIPLELDHINGAHSDNSLENLRLLCPNCHAQTPYHAGKNKGNGKYS